MIRVNLGLIREWRNKGTGALSGQGQERTGCLKPLQPFKRSQAKGHRSIRVDRRSRIIICSKVKVPRTPWLLDQASPEACSTFGLGELHDWYIPSVVWASLSWFHCYLPRFHSVTYSLPDLYLQYAEGKEMKWMFKMVLTLLSASKVLSQTLNCFSSTIAKWSPSCHCGSNLSATHFFHSFQK